MFVDLVDKPYIFHEFCPNERITKKRIVKHYNASNQYPTKLCRPDQQHFDNPGTFAPTNKNDPQ